MYRILRGGKALALLVLLMGVGVAQGAEYTDNGGRLNEAVGGFLNAAEANSAAGDIYANVMGASINAQQEFRRALPSIGDTLAKVSPDSNWMIWAVPFLTKETQKAGDGYLGYEQNVTGFATGISWMLGESSMVGLAVGYDQWKMTERDEYNMQNEADTFHVALLGGANIRNFFIDGYAGYSRSRNRSEHDIYTAGPVFYQTNKANYSDSIMSAGAKVSYVWTFPNDMRIMPSVGLDVSRVSIDSFNERTHGDPTTTISGRKSSYSSMAVPIMVTMNKTFASDFLAFGGYDSMWTPEARVGYVSQFGNQRAEINMSENMNYEHYTVKSSELAGSYGTVGGGLKIKLSNKHTLGIDYDYLFGNNYTNHSLTAIYNMSF